MRPRWETNLGFIEGLGVNLLPNGLVEKNADGVTSVPGVFVADDLSPRGPHQLIVAAGEGARYAAVMNRYLIGPL